MRVALQKNESGFTLIELVVVIVILGILAATALPKFVDMSGDARKAATNGVAAALNSGSNINYSASLAKGQVQGATLSTATAMTGVQDTTAGCTTGVAGGLVQAGVTFDNSATPAAGTYKIAGGALTTVGASTTCTITNNDDPTKSATFILLGAK